ncbi:MAG: hypothetical protein H6935_06025 [Thiobacillus sp.]|nr:hypothetical protein [Thiobacillus sp.]
MKIPIASLLAALVLPAAADAYRSTTADYTPYQDSSMTDWRGANDEMGRLKGHMGHMDRMGGPSGNGGHGHAMGHQEALRPPDAVNTDGHPHHSTGGRP